MSGIFGADEFGHRAQTELDASASHARRRPRAISALIAVPLMSEVPYTVEKLSVRASDASS